MKPVKIREILVVMILAAGAGALSLIISLTILDGIPHISDELSYAFQARIIAAGRLSLPPPPLPELFAQQNVILDSVRWCSKYPPGWPLLLSLGSLAGAPFVVNPLLLAAAVAGAWYLGRRLFNSAAGLLGAGLLACSPFALLMGAGFMAHVAVLALSLWCLGALAPAFDGSGSRRAFLAAGLLGGLAFLVRPYTALLLLWPGAVFCLFRQRPARRFLGALGCLAAGALPGILVFLAYNWAVFGNPLLTGYSVYNPTEQLSGIHGIYAPRTELLVHHIPWYFHYLNRCLWGWPWPNLLILVPLAWPRPGRSKDSVLLASALSLVAGYSVFYFCDIVYSGPRFAFEALGPLSLLAARALLTLQDGISAALRRARRLSDGTRRIARAAVSAAALLVLLLYPLASRLPKQMEHHAQWYHGVSAAPLRSASKAGVGSSALVFVSGSAPGFGSFFLENPLDPRTGKRVYVRDIPGLGEPAKTAFPRAEVWRVTVDLEPFPGPNIYAEAFRPRDVSWQRLR